MLWLKRRYYDGMAAQARVPGVALPPIQHVLGVQQLHPASRSPGRIASGSRHAPTFAITRCSTLGTPVRQDRIFSNTVAGMGYADCTGHPR